MPEPIYPPYWEPATPPILPPTDINPARNKGYVSEGVPIFARPGDNVGIESVSAGSTGRVTLDNAFRVADIPTGATATLLAGPRHKFAAPLTVLWSGGAGAQFGYVGREEASNARSFQADDGGGNVARWTAPAGFDPLVRYELRVEIEKLSATSARVSVFVNGTEAGTAQTLAAAFWPGLEVEALFGDLFALQAGLAVIHHLQWYWPADPDDRLVRLWMQEGAGTTTKSQGSDNPVVTGTMGGDTRWRDPYTESTVWTPARVESFGSNVARTAPEYSNIANPGAGAVGRIALGLEGRVQLVFGHGRNVTTAGSVRVLSYPGGTELQAAIALPIGGLVSEFDVPAGDTGITVETTTALTGEYQLRVHDLNLIPSIVVHPVSQVRAVSGATPVQLAVAALDKGLPLTYQWRKGEVDIPGATGPTYEISLPQAADAGLYDCVVTNSAGAQKSFRALVSMYAAAAFTNGVRLQGTTGTGRGTRSQALPVLAVGQAGAINLTLAPRAATGWRMVVQRAGQAANRFSGFELSADLSQARINPSAGLGAAVDISGLTVGATSVVTLHALQASAGQYAYQLEIDGVRFELGTVDTVPSWEILGGGAAGDFESQLDIPIHGYTFHQTSEHYDLLEGGGTVSTGRNAETLTWAGDFAWLVVEPDVRVTEAGDTRVTESGDRRILQ